MTEILKNENPEIPFDCVVDRCVSTNDLAKKLAELQFPHGTYISSRIQESGKGRLGRRWESIEGNLFLSIVARIEDRNLWSWVPLVSALATVLALKEKFPTLDLQIKWPNDIFCKDAKLGGILCEGGIRNSQPFIVIGIGVNCVSSPRGLPQDATDLTILLGAGEKIQADAIRMDVLSRVLSELEMLEQEGPERFKKIYNGCAALPPGEAIQWGIPSQSEQNPLFGIVKGLGPVGELEVFLTENKITRLFAEDVKIYR